MTGSSPLATAGRCPAGSRRSRWRRRRPRARQARSFPAPASGQAASRASQRTGIQMPSVLSASIWATCPVPRPRQNNKPERPGHDRCANANHAIVPMRCIVTVLLPGFALIPRRSETSANRHGADPVRLETTARSVFYAASVCLEAITIAGFAAKNRIGAMNF